jgi:hypothetical protein
MAKPRWNRALTWPLHTRDGQTIKTLADARAFMLDLPAQYSERKHWQHAAGLMLESSKGGGVYEASAQLKKALFLDMRLDVVRTPA